MQLNTYKNAHNPHSLPSIRFIPLHNVSAPLTLFNKTARILTKTQNNYD
jgi:hypothetical protein